MAPRKLYIFPFNGNGIEALDCLNPAEYEFMGFIDDNEEKKKAKNPWPVYGREILENENEAFVLAVPGSPLSYPQRASHIASLGLPEHRFATVIHPGAHIGENCYIGSGTNIINGIKIGARTLIGLGSNVLRGTTEQATIAGNPAKPIVKKEA